MEIEAREAIGGERGIIIAFCPLCGQQFFKDCLDGKDIHPCSVRDGD